MTPRRAAAATLRKALRSCKFPYQVDQDWRRQLQPRSVRDHVARVKKLAVLRALPRAIGALHRLTDTTDACARDPALVVDAYRSVLACALKSGTPWVAVELALCVGAKPHRVQLDADGLAFALSAVVKMDRAPSVQTCVLPALHLDPARIELLALRLGDPWKPSLHSQLSARLRLSSPPSVALGFVRRVSPSLVESALDANLGAFPASYPGLLGLLELTRHYAHGSKALKTLETMCELGLDLRVRVYNNACDALVSDPFVRVTPEHLAALEAAYLGSTSLDSSRKRRMDGQYDARFASKLLVGYCQSTGDAKYAHIERLLAQFERHKLRLEEHCFAALVDAFQHDAARAETILTWMDAVKVPRGVRTSNAILHVLASPASSLSSSARVSAALGVFIRLCVEGHDKTLGAAGLRFQQALVEASYFPPAPADSVFTTGGTLYGHPNRASFAALSAVLVQARDASALSRLVASFATAPASTSSSSSSSRSPCPLGPEVFHDLIFVFGDAGMPDQAARVVGDMQRLSVSVDGDTLDVLVKALLAKDKSNVKLAVGHLVALCRSLGFAPAAGTLMTLLEAALAVHDRDEAGRVRALFEEFHPGVGLMDQIVRGAAAAGGGDGM